MSSSKKIEKKNYNYFRHEINSHKQPAFVRLISQYGMDALGQWWVLVELCASNIRSQTKDYTNIPLIILDRLLELDLRLKKKKIEKLLNALQNLELIKFSIEEYNPNKKRKMFFYHIEVIGLGNCMGSNSIKKKSDQFYISKEWREIRYEVIKKYGNKCACCFATDIELHVDHIKPRSKYPQFELDINNLQILCKDCNLGKGNSDCIKWDTNSQDF